MAKRCLQLFDKQYQKKLDRKASLVIEKEKKAKKNFNNFSTLKKLKIVDDARQKHMKRKDKQVNNIKWQLNGVLDEYH